MSNVCPYCDATMQPAVMRCQVCDLEVRGRFRQTLFQMLDANEQRLLEEYLLAGFSIKALAHKTGMGYAAIRTRLDRLIEHYERLRKGDEEEKRILEQVAEGNLSASEAAALIAKIQSG